MPTNLERVAEQVYSKWNENLIGCCEPTWAETDESFKVRFLESIIEMLKVIREPNDAQYNALCSTDKMWKELSSRTVWQIYIDTLIKD